MCADYTWGIAVLFLLFVYLNECITVIIIVSTMRKISDNGYNLSKAVKMESHELSARCEQGLKNLS